MSQDITEAPAVSADSQEIRRLHVRLSTASRSPAPVEDSELAAVDFSVLDVLVGTVRSDEQFDWCIQSRSYYIPAKTVTPDDLPVSVIALYEDGLTRCAGIKRYGEILDTRVVSRADIPVPMSRHNPDEAYYLFTVRDWDYLKQPIAILDTARGKPMFTNRFLLTHSRRSYQLVGIRSPEEYRLCQLLCKLEEDAATEKTLFRRVGESHLMTLSEGWVRLLDAGGHSLCAFPVGMLESAPAQALHRVARGLGLRD